MADMMWTTEDGHGNVLAQETVEVPDPTPTVEERLTALEDPAGDGKTLADKLDELQQVLVDKRVIDETDRVDVKAAAEEAAVEGEIP